MKCEENVIANLVTVLFTPLNPATLFALSIIGFKLDFVFVD
jgi:hypothetical protein